MPGRGWLSEQTGLGLSFKIQRPVPEKLETAVASEVCVRSASWILMRRQRELFSTGDIQPCRERAVYP